MPALRILVVLSVLVWASTASTMEIAYADISAGGDNLSIDVVAAGCNTLDGCYNRNGVPCNVDDPDADGDPNNDRCIV